MIGDQDSDQPLPLVTVPGSWQAGIFLGALTLILGLIVSFHPTGSLNVIAVLLGILMIISGVFHLVRVFTITDSNRVWLVITALLFIVLGVVLIRHLHLSRALIGLVIGITFIVQGVAELARGTAGGAREGRTWWIAFGALSVIAGIFVTASPVSSLNVLAVLTGVWFAIMGVFEMIGGLLLWHEARDARVSEPKHA
ncbi:MAG TPA: DUF308 domain-containing protein [Streptosporangiaceae bacterium]|jgi:uncharacterized membrane protein HdeD (DUF308 family)